MFQYNCESAIINKNIAKRWVIIMKALFIIDMQEEYVGQNNKYGYSADFVDKANERIDEADKDRELIVYIKNRKTLKSGLVCPEFADELKIISDNVFYKDRSDCLSNTGLIKWLNDNDVTEIETIGVDGNCCVGSCAASAKNKGFDVILPLKYVGVRNKKRFEKNKDKLLKIGVRVLE